MSKFGAHISAGKRDGIGTALQQCAAAGSPVPVLFCVDQDLSGDVARYSPETILIFRTQPGGLDFPATIYQGDPIASANAWYDLCAQKWALNTADYYACDNEPNPNQNDEAQHRWLDAWHLQLMKRADSDDRKLAIYGASLGTPDYPDWQYHTASLAYASQHGHILSLHEPVSGNSLALRYRDVHYLTQAYAPDLKIVISECYGIDMGNWPAYVDSFKAYDVEAMHDPYMICFGAYQLGGDENWYTEIQRWADWVSTHPTPIIAEPPPGWIFDGHFNGETGELISMDKHLSGDLLGDVNIETRYHRAAPEPVYHTFKHTVEPPEAAALVTVTPAPGRYEHGTHYEVTAL